MVYISKIMIEQFRNSHATKVLDKWKSDCVSNDDSVNAFPILLRQDHR